MKRFLVFSILSFSLCLSTAAQTAKAPISTPAKYDSEIALAKLALEAHGGEKFRAMKSLIVRG